MKYTISESLLNKIAGYLGTRPYAEVIGLINNIQEEIQGQNKANEEASLEA